MGIYYYYGNPDRKEYFSIGVGAEGIKRGSIGCGFGARALGLLLLEKESVPGLAGSWAEQRVIVFGDETASGDTFLEEGRDISSAVLLMLFADNGDALLDRADTDDLLFLQLAELAIVHGANELAAALQRRFGADWKSRYGRIRKEHDHVVVPAP